MKLVATALLGLAVVGVLALKPNTQGPTPGADRDAGVSAPEAAAQVPRLLDLGSVNCIPCKAMAPILEQLRQDYAGRLQVDFIDVWKDHAASERYRVGIIPTQIFFAADGRELWRHEGFFSREEILARWTQLGVRVE